MSKNFINYMRGKGVEPTEHDVDHFSFMANLHSSEKIEELESRIDLAHSALEEVLRSGCCDERMIEVIKAGMFVGGGDNNG